MIQEAAMIRDPIFAMQGWYPYDRAAAEHELSLYLKSDRTPTPAVAVIAPHAGWAYSGRTAGKVYADVVVPERVAAFCPMHRAGGPPVAVWTSGAWRTPLGDMAVDEEFTAALLKRTPLAREDFPSHLSEHAIEIHLPFIQARNAKARLAPIRLGRLRYEDCRELGQAVAETIRRAKGDTLLLASTDMSHEGDMRIVEENDRLARERVLALDAMGLMDVVEARDITMCGFIAVAVVIEAALALGATKATGLAYATSAEISGRTDYIVGYFGARLDR
ncbi:MAG: AmmeMemoRadiSam system protein B [Myxococcales bacterium]|nr:MAG: AmmeMemoRadiSam system protein B [Myxococcales bacterium]